MPYQVDFEKMFLFTLGQEGVYSNDTADAGGETFHGISRIYNPGWQGWKLVDAFKNDSNFPTSATQDLQIKKLTLDFYYEKYAVPVKLLSYSQYIGAFMFDTAVNCGQKTAIKFLQAAAKKLGVALEVDGVFGEDTLGAVKSLEKINRVSCLLSLLWERQIYYNGIRDKGQNKKFYAGWILRTHRLFEFALTI